MNNSFLKLFFFNIFLSLSNYKKIHSYLIVTFRLSVWLYVFFLHSDSRTVLGVPIFLHETKYKSFPFTDDTYISYYTYTIWCFLNFVSLQFRFSLYNQKNSVCINVLTIYHPHTRKTINNAKKEMRNFFTRNLTIYSIYGCVYIYCIRTKRHIWKIFYCSGDSGKCE